MTSEFPDLYRESLSGNASCETVTREKPRPVALLPELPASPWRSLGKRFDYSTWDARDRFVELDAAILVRQQLDLLNAQRIAAQSMSAPGVSSPGISGKGDSLPSAA